MRTADLIPNVARSLHHDRDSEKSYGSLVMDRSHDPTRGTYLSHHPIITRFFNPGKNLVPPNRIRPKRNGASDVDNDLLTSVANAPLDDIHQSINIRGPTLFLISTWEMKSLHRSKTRRMFCGIRPTSQNAFILLAPNFLYSLVCLVMIQSAVRFLGVPP